MPKLYLPHLIFFIFFLAAAIPILFYLQRKNPHPHFRPGVGEMSMVTIMAVCLCAAIAFGLGSLFKPENDGKSFSKKPSEGAGWSAGGAASSEGGNRKSKEKESDSDSDDPPRRTLNDRL